MAITCSKLDLKVSCDIFWVAYISFSPSYSNGLPPSAKLYSDLSSPAFYAWLRVSNSTSVFNSSKSRLPSALNIYIYGVILFEFAYEKRIVKVLLQTPKVSVGFELAHAELLLARGSHFVFSLAKTCIVVWNNWILAFAQFFLRWNPCRVCIVEFA
jgi:hypothetical protein